MRRVDLFRDRKNKKADGLHGQGQRGEKANNHFVQGCIMLFQEPNKSIDILTENITLLKETLEKIEQLAVNLNVVTNNRLEEEHSPAVQLPTSGL